MTTNTPPVTVELVAIDLLRPDPANPRRIDEDELDALERSIRQFGFVQPVLARLEDGVVIGGHQRLVAARRLGLATVPVTYLDLSIEQARLLNLALNKISGSWDEQLLARLLVDLAVSPEVDLSLSGFGEDEVLDLLRSWPRGRPISHSRRPQSTGPGPLSMPRFWRDVCRVSYGAPVSGAR